MAQLAGSLCGFPTRSLFCFLGNILGFAGSLSWSVQPQLLGKERSPICLLGELIASLPQLRSRWWLGELLGTALGLSLVATQRKKAHVSLQS